MPTALPKARLPESAHFGYICRLKHSKVNMNTNKLARVVRALVSGDFDLEVPKRRTSSGIALFLGGVGTGMILGMLFAPVTGEQLRSEVSDRAREGLQRVRSSAQNVAALQKDPAPAVSAEKSAS